MLDLLDSNQVTDEGSGSLTLASLGYIVRDLINTRSAPNTNRNL